ncbi:hypothetical protein BRC79_07485 [Halobacteriales archaeon QH_8_67_27]|nr:MAG: hypothetical protein BRC79_07485 [Halobacteriales archaeon QH_8_67_27]
MAQWSMARAEDRVVRSQPLGRCPNCEVMIPPGNLLIKYETDDGWPKLFAECPDCRDPVHPE